MTLYAAIGGMQLKRWTGYFKIIWPTLKVLRHAKASSGCVHADTFKDGNVFFAVSVWEDKEQMKVFAKSGLHGNLASLAQTHMAMFHNHTQVCEAVPNREQAVAFWKAAMKERNWRGSVGELKNQ